MEQKVTVEIPEKHIAFANAIAKLAEENSIDSFYLEYEPDYFNDRSVAWDRSVKGKARINYKSRDGRGRPCRKLSVSFDASFIHIIETNPES